MQDRLKDALGLIARGFCMGAADVVPGVSGGTMAFILGIYTRFIDAIRSFDLPWLLACLRFDLRTAWQRPHLHFIVPLLAGIVAAIAFFTRVVPLPQLLHTHPEEIYALFFGLIAASIVVLMRGVIHIGRLGLRDVGALAAGFALGWLVVTAVPAETPTTWWFVMLSGSLAICAMVLPGISGSFVLLILGKYAYVLDALGHLEFAVIVPFAAGAALGLFLFTRFLSWLLHRWTRAALLGITGILCASLWVVWPFQHRVYVVVREKQRLLETQPVLPAADTALLLPVVLALAGFGLVMVLEHLAASARR